MNENEVNELRDNKIFVESNNLQIFKELMEDSFQKSISTLIDEISTLRSEIESIKSTVDNIKVIRGPQGPTGPVGPTGPRGKNGNSWKPVVDEEGNISWSLDDTSIQPTPRSIRGPQGKSIKPIFRIAGKSLQYRLEDEDESNYKDIGDVVGENGKAGRSTLVSTVFKADSNTPPTPTGGSFNDPVPEGWSDSIPERTTANPTIYMSRRMFTSDGVEQDSVWSIPVIAYDSQFTDICFHPATSSGSQPTTPATHGTQGTNTTTWHDEGNPNDVWMAISYKDARGWSEWSISKIKGEDGDIPEFEIDESSGKLRYRFRDNPFSDLAKVVGENGKTPALKWNGTKLQIAADGVTFDSGVELRGAQGAAGANGKDGINGDTWIPNVASDGTISWTKNTGATSITSRNIRGPQGPTGLQGPQGIAGVDGKTPALRFEGNKLQIAADGVNFDSGTAVSNCYLGDWDSNGKKYYEGDIVTAEYCGKLNGADMCAKVRYICIANHTSKASDMTEFRGSGFPGLGGGNTNTVYIKQLHTDYWKRYLEAEFS